MKYWALQFRSRNKMDGYREHLVWSAVGDVRIPKLFVTRREAREWKKERYGYINLRPDLRAEPHGWMPVKVVRVRLNFEVLQ